MSLKTWAEREVELACTREREGNDKKEGEWDYGCACYESALKAFKSLLEDGHSGFSIGITKQILNRLIEGKPLTPIEDTDDVWGLLGENLVDRFTGKKYTSYQCGRMSSLFKDVYEDGTVIYSDNNRYSAFDVNEPDPTPYHSGMVCRVIDETFPIIMPYYPGEQIKVYCEDLLTDPKNGDFDTVGILYAIKDDEKLGVYRYFKESDDGWEEITADEYADRKRKAEARKDD